MESKGYDLSVQRGLTGLHWSETAYRLVWNRAGVRSAILTRPNWRIGLIHKLSHLMGAGLPGHTWRYITGFGALEINLGSLGIFGPDAPVRIDAVIYPTRWPYSETAYSYHRHVVASHGGRSPWTLHGDIYRVLALS